MSEPLHSMETVAPLVDTRLGILARHHETVELIVHQPQAGSISTATTVSLSRRGVLALALEQLLYLTMAVGQISTTWNRVGLVNTKKTVAAEGVVCRLSELVTAVRHQCAIVGTTVHVTCRHVLALH
jgi:hypothetical protein